MSERLSRGTSVAGWEQVHFWEEVQLALRRHAPANVVELMFTPQPQENRQDAAHAGYNRHGDAEGAIWHWVQFVGWGLFVACSSCGRTSEKYSSIMRCWSRRSK